MAGLLDQVASMFGFGAPQQQNAYGTSTGQPWDESSIPLPGYDPQAARRAQFSRALLEAGARIASAPRGQAVGQGLLGVLGGIDQGKQDYQDGLLSQAKWDQYRRDQQSQDAMRRGLEPLLNPSGNQYSVGMTVPQDLGYASGTGIDGANKISGGRTMPGGSPTGATPMATLPSPMQPNDPFADIPQNVRQVALSYAHAGDIAGAWKTINDFRLKGPPALPGKVGEYQAALVSKSIPAGTTYQQYLALDNPTPTDLQEYAQARNQGFNGTFMDYKIALNRASANSTTVKLPPMENKYDETRGVDIAKVRSDVETAATAAQGTLDQLNLYDTASNLLAGAGGSTGWGADKINEASKLALQLGLDPKTLNLGDRVAATDWLKGITNKLALGGVGPGGLPANNFSEADRNFIVGIVPNIGDTDQGRALKAEAARRVAQRNIEAYQFSQNYPDTADGTRQFKKEWAAYVRQHPLFTQQEIDSVKAMTGGGAGQNHIPTFDPATGKWN